MKETIEWYRVAERIIPSDDAEILMKLGEGSTRLGGLTGVFVGSFHSLTGFRLPGGEDVIPTMWCYFPKGEQ